MANLPMSVYRVRFLERKSPQVSPMDILAVATTASEAILTVECLCLSRGSKSAPNIISVERICGEVAIASGVLSMGVGRG